MQFFRRNKKSFILKLFYFLREIKVKTLILGETNDSHIRSFFYDLRQQIWLVKQLIWILSSNFVNARLELNFFF